MGSFVRLSLIALFGYLIFGLYLSNYSIGTLPDQTIVPEPPRGFFDYRGVVNVHSSASTGSGSIDSIVLAAQNARLNFVMLTDLNVFPPNKLLEGYRDNLLLMVDAEYSYLDSRFLYLDIRSPNDLLGPGQIQTILGDKLSQQRKADGEGIFIISHPLKPGFGWNGPYPPGLDGIEVINLRSVWESSWRNERVSFIWSLLTYPFNSQLSFLRLIGNLKNEFSLWDQLTSQRPTFGISGSDAEAKIRFSKSKYFEFPSYETLFSITSNHLLLKSELTGSFNEDKQKVLSALRSGQLYMSFDLIANPVGFNATIKNARDEVLLMGSRIPFESDLTLQVVLPNVFSENSKVKETEILVIRSGKSVFQTSQTKLSYPIQEPGVYRIVVRARPRLPFPDGDQWFPWIVSNPFYIQ